MSISEQEGVRFSFRDAQVRAWLRDVGSALELHIYQSCRALGVFDDVRTSVVVDWQGGNQPDAVTNEIDVMATCGVRPIFISCKTCDVKTEALNELAILRDRFWRRLPAPPSSQPSAAAPPCATAPWSWASM